jgi:SAM-dependent methyltransferase
MLDVPSGAGRLADVFLKYSRQLCEIDASLEMLRLLRAAHAPPNSEIPLTVGVASVFHLPFRERSFDAVVSLRLSHHIADLDGRLWHLDEILRLARHHVLVSFFDAQSLKNRLRELRRALGSSKRPKYTLSRAAVARRATAAGFDRHQFFGLAPVVSGHTFALLSRS